MNIQCHVQKRSASMSIHAGALLRVIMMITLLLGTQYTYAGVSCTVSATGPAFGTYNPLSASPTLANGSVTATCTLTGNSSTTVNITSSYSKGSSSTYSSRTMKSGTNVLNYNLYFDAAFTQIRGDGTGGSQTGGGTLNLTPSSRTQTTPDSVIYGRVPAGQDVAAGSYSDTIIVTITY
jgi:spore coat protein U-like protein